MPLGLVMSWSGEISFEPVEGVVRSAYHELRAPLAVPLLTLRRAVVLHHEARLAFGDSVVLVASAFRCPPRLTYL